VSGTYAVIYRPSARRQLQEGLQPGVAFAVVEFIAGPLSENPQRVGKRLQGQLAHLHSARRGTFRILYEIDEEDRTITIVKVEARRDAYRAL
jgi:mRNA interferase RelE/StbE